MPQPLDGRIDRVTREVVDSFDQAPYFTKAEVIDQAIARPVFQRTISQLRRQFRNSGIDEVYITYIRSRLDRFLQRKVRYGVRRNGRPIQVREFENYAPGAGNGPRRWRKLQAMSESDLRSCLARRRVNIAEEQAIARAYEVALALLENTPTANSVADIWEQALQQIAAQP